MNYCGICGKSEVEAELIDDTDDWLGCWRCRHEDKGCTSARQWLPRQRHYAELTPEVLDRLEEEGDKEDHECEMYGAREISGPELLSLIRVVRQVREAALDWQTYVHNWEPILDSRNEEHAEMWGELTAMRQCLRDLGFP